MSNLVCPIAGCKDHKQPDSILCAKHWAMVSPDMKREIWKASTRSKSKSGRSLKVRREYGIKLVVLQVKAREAVEQKLIGT